MHAEPNDAMEASHVDNRLEWVEPVVAELTVRETQAYPSVGGGGNTYSPGGHSDCSSS